VSSRFISAVAQYGPKAEPVRGLLAGVQAQIAEHLGDGFRPYSLDQVHATLIAFNGVRDPGSGAIVNEYYLEHTGARREMDLDMAMRILGQYFERPLRIRIGGYRRDEAVPFLSRGQHLFERTFSAQGNAFVLIGWPIGPGRPLDRLRRDMNGANVLHRYHQGADDIDDDFYLVVGHQADAPAAEVERAVRAVREKLAVDPVEFDVGIDDVKIVAAESHTLVAPLFVGAVPVAAATLGTIQIQDPLSERTVVHVQRHRSRILDEPRRPTRRPVALFA
jgi:hypothetical protein